MKTSSYQPKTGEKCHCKRGIVMRIDFRKIRAVSPVVALQTNSTWGSWDLYTCEGIYRLFATTAPGCSEKTSEQRAKFTALAYNCHDDLLAALKALLADHLAMSKEQHAKGRGKVRPCVPWSELPIQATARAAIAKAEGAK